MIMDVFILQSSLQLVEKLVKLITAICQASGVESPG